MPAALKIDNLACRRSRNFCLKVDNLRLTPGTVLCITGPNGSGKTTLVDCIVGLLRPDQGAITIKGMPVSQNLRCTKAQIGFVPDDENWLIKELCAKEYFSLLCKIYRDAGVTTEIENRILELTSLLHFNALLEPLSNLSHGNKKKAQIIAALMHSPSLIVLDEIRNGLDPLAVIAVEQIIKKEAQRGACVIASTHDLWWAERISDQLLLMIDGEVRVNRNTADIIKSHGSVENFFLEKMGD